MLTSLIAGVSAAVHAVPIPVLPADAARRMRGIAEILFSAARAAQSLALAFERIRDDVSPEREFTKPESAERYGELAYEVADSADDDPFQLGKALSRYRRLAETIRPGARTEEDAELPPRLAAKHRAADLIARAGGITMRTEEDAAE